MDPAIALLNAIIALRDNDREAADEAIKNYEEWRRKEGFEPQVPVAGDQLKDLLVSTFTLRYMKD